MKHVKSCLVVTAALACAGLVPASIAPAATYTLKACQADRANYNSQAFQLAATRGMRKSGTCRPARNSLRGIVVKSARKARIRPNARAYARLVAAPGTVFKKFTWSGALRRTSCAYALEIYATGPFIRNRKGKLVRKRIDSRPANSKCPRPGSTGSASRDAEVDDLAGATQIVQKITCKSRRGNCSSRGSNYVQLRKVELEVEDVAPPSVRITGGSLFGGWVNGERTVAFEASDNLGIASARLNVGGGTQDKGRPCNRALTVPCLNGSDVLEARTLGFAEGSQQATVTATDGSGLSQVSAPVLAQIDNTAPVAAQLSASESGSWRSANSFGATWSNAPENDRAPIVSARYRLCRQGGSCEEPKAVDAENISSFGGIQVPSPGEWTVRMWRVDAAGNTDERNASEPVPLRYDPEAPKLAVDPLLTTDPTLLSASIEDPLSGPASGQLEIAQEGTGTWQTLPTTLTNGRLQARVDDTKLPAGRYLVRVSGADNAGNSGQTDERADGSAAVITLPLRAESRLSAGFLATKVVRKKVRRKGKRKTVRRKVRILVSSARVKRNELTYVRGRLATADGSGLPNAAVYVFVTGADGTERYAGIANTDIAGRYQYGMRAPANQTLRFAYLGAASVRPTNQNVMVTVPAQPTLKASRRSLLNGQRVRFRGRLRAAPSAMAGGKIIELQTRLKRRWETFRALRTDQTGRWSYTYRFKGTRGLQRYRFRVHVPAEGGYPYGTGVSRAIRLKVRGR